ncbi:hypothetical protein NFI95_11575 [Acetobacteraceae bacterium KSS8]|uniref:Uncharacterized protein n=2 Tax=Endosaccharibacter trunci TaxID=2812733 RepID=A0ABT1W875_9PROT|nr:hypothetical protein [Acetobacteraceae bacterium KSS8]
MADLIPVPDGKMDRWDIDPRMDPYLICSYAGVKQPVEIHEKGAKACFAADKPARAWCR